MLYYCFACEGWVSLKAGFDNALYIERQAQKIKERINSSKGKLYLEFGGKLFDDYHAARVLPGFDANGKIKLLYELRDEAEIIFCVSAGDIEKTKMRADLGITYDMEVLRLIDEIRAFGIAVNSVVITQYTGQPAAELFVSKLTNRGVKNYIHRPIAGYPTNIDNIVSDQGYGSNAYIETTKPLVVVTAPGPGSGKLATCLSQVYHENKRGNHAGYAKFETFPVWNLPLKHPVNIAYEAATADLMDLNVIDDYHLEAYGVSAVNYNRDVDAFPIVKTILTRIMGNENVYKSPTDMGVNMIGYAIADDAAVRYAAEQEIICRYFRALCASKQGKANEKEADKIAMLLQQLDLKRTDRPCVTPALMKAAASNCAAAAIELDDGRIVAGRQTELMSAAASAVLNSIKALGGIDDSILLIAPDVLAPILRLKIDVLGSKSSVLKLDDVLIALSISAVTNKMSELAVTQLGALYGCDIHTTQMLHNGDESALRKLGIRTTNEPVYPSKDLYF